MKSSRLTLVLGLGSAAWFALLVVVMAVFPPSLPAQVFDKSNLEAVFDHEAFNEFKALEVSSVEELAGDFEFQQSLYIGIYPPSEEYIGWTQDAEPVYTLFQPSKFPGSFVASLIPIVRERVTVYPVFVMENPVTRARQFFNADSELIASLPPPPGYDPLWMLKAEYPGVTPLELAGDYFQWFARVADPSHLVIRYDCANNPVNARDPKGEDRAIVWDGIHMYIVVDRLINGQIVGSYILDYYPGYFWGRSSWSITLSLKKVREYKSLYFVYSFECEDAQLIQLWYEAANLPFRQTFAPPYTLFPFNCIWASVSFIEYGRSEFSFSSYGVYDGRSEGGNAPPSAVIMK